MNIICNVTIVKLNLPLIHELLLYRLDNMFRTKKHFITDANTILHGNDINRYKDELKHRFKTMTIINIICT